MKHKMRLLFVSFICLVLLAGCWDQRLLKDTRFILAISFDKTKDGNLKGTYATPNALVTPASAIITEVEGKTIRDLTFHVNDKVSEKLDISKLKVVLIGDTLAKEDGIYPYLDILLREPNSPISPFLFIAKGDVSSYFTEAIPDESLPGEYYRLLIQKEVDRGASTNMNILKSSKIFKAAHTDILLPYLEQSKDNTPIVSGLAIFDQDKFTGKTLSTEESVIYNLLNNKKNEEQPSLIVKIKDEEESEIENYISLSVLQSKRKMNIISKNEQVSGQISLDLDVSIIESPKYNVVKNRDAMTTEIEKNLTKRANKLIKKLQEANSDGLAIGQYLHSFHHQEFKKLDWKGTAYKNAKITANVNVKIKEHGLIN
ncbi:MAG: Ger(x)C family spore germination protein [Bacillus sp. (in: firmicutes)]